MKVDAILPAAGLERIGALARQAEALGFQGLLVPEVGRDPFLALTLAAEHTTALDIASYRTTAFPRSPMHLAQVSHDLQAYCRGRLSLCLSADDVGGLERRFGVDGSHPAARMREVVGALRAIWRTWNEGVPLQFEGTFYRHTLMTPAFVPSATGCGAPRIVLDVRDAEMAELAGEVADGLLVSPASEDHLGEIVLPALERGLRRSGRQRSDVEVSVVPAPGFKAAYEEVADRLALPLS